MPQHATITHRTQRNYITIRAFTVCYKYNQNHFFNRRHLRWENTRTGFEQIDQMTLHRSLLCHATRTCLASACRLCRKHRYSDPKRGTVRAHQQTAWCGLGETARRHQISSAETLRASARVYLLDSPFVACSWTQQSSLTRNHKWIRNQNIREYIISLCL